MASDEGDYRRGMIKIQVQRLQPKLEALRGASMRLVRLGKAPDSQFLNAAWRVANLLASIESNALGYLFHPDFTPVYGDRMPKPFSSDRPWPDCLLDTLYTYLYPDIDLWERGLRNLSAAIGQEALETIKDPWANPQRAWLGSCLLQVKYEAPPPQIGTSTDWTHLAAYHAFHMGKLDDFAKAITKVQQKHPNQFWRAFLAWHARSHSLSIDSDLKRLVADRRAKPGFRKCALLLLWTASNLSAEELVKLTKSSRQLLSPRVKYRGSGELPVQQTDAKDSLAQLFNRLEALSTALKADSTNAGKDGKRKEMLKVAEKILGGRAVPKSMGDSVEKLRNPALRVLVYGGAESNRKNLARITAAFNGKEKSNWYEVTNVLFNHRYKLFEDMIVAWQEAGSTKHLPAEFADKAILALEIQTWEKKNQALLFELLYDPRPLKGCLDLPVVVTLSQLDEPSMHEPSMKLLPERLAFKFNLDLGPDEPEWMSRYVQLSYKEIGKLIGHSKSTVAEMLRPVKAEMTGTENSIQHEKKTYVRKAWLEAKKKENQIKQSNTVPGSMRSLGASGVRRSEN